MSKIKKKRYNWSKAQENTKKSYKYYVSEYHKIYIDIKVLFIRQLMHYWVVLKNNIEIYIKIYIKTSVLM